MATKTRFEEEAKGNSEMAYLFERSERVKRFIEVSPRRRHLKLYRARRTDRMTLSGMHFAVVADKLDLSSTERRLEKEKYNFYWSPIPYKIW